jgi:hemolysin III
VAPAKPWIKFASLALYMLMGWSIVFPPLLRDVRAAMPADAFQLLVAGGLAYTLGVPVFVRNRPLDHVIWHMFVVAGSACHYFSLLKLLPAALRDTI